MAKKNFNNGSVSNILKKVSENNSTINAPVIREINLNDIIDNENNRFSMEEDIKFLMLVESIKRVGVLQPVLLKKENGKYKIVAGHRRVRASHVAGLNTIKSFIKEYDNDNLNELLDLIETNTTTRDISIDDMLNSIDLIEEIVQQKNIKIDGNMNDYIGTLLERSGKTIERYKKLRNLIPEIKEKVDNKELGISTAEGLHLLDENKQNLALKEIEKKELVTGKNVTRDEMKEIKSNIKKTENIIPELQEKIINNVIELETVKEIEKLDIKEQKQINENIDKVVQIEEKTDPLSIVETIEIIETITDKDKVIEKNYENISNENLTYENKNNQDSDNELDSDLVKKSKLLNQLFNSIVSEFLTSNNKDILLSELEGFSETLLIEIERMK